MRLIFLSLFISVVFAIDCNTYLDSSVCISNGRCMWCLDNNECMKYSACGNQTCANFLISPSHSSCSNIQDLYFWTGFVLNFGFAVLLGLFNISTFGWKKEKAEKEILIVTTITFSLFINIFLATLTYFFTPYASIAFLMEIIPLFCILLFIIIASGVMLVIVSKVCYSQLLSRVKKVDDELAEHQVSTTEEVIYEFNS